MRKVLLTGFEAFGTTPVNPAEQVARRLDGETVDGAAIVSRVIPNTFLYNQNFTRMADDNGGHLF